jgi:hypothetical protein
MLRRLFANVGMMVPALVPGGRFGKSMVAVVDECSSFPSAMPTVIGLALQLMLDTGAFGTRKWKLAPVSAMAVSIVGFVGGLQVEAVESNAK